MKQEILDDGFEHRNRQTNQENKEQTRLIKIEADSNIRDIKVGRGTLIALAILVLLSFNNQNLLPPYSTEMLMSIFCLFAYILCAWNVKNKPRPSLLTGLLIYLFFMILNFVLTGRIAVFKILLSVPVVYFLATSIKAASELEKNLIQLEELGMGSAELDSVAALNEFSKS